jgi:glycosyltransferase involved in cell wall biosynthesis
MNIALVGKFDGNGWRMESMVQRALWNLNHEVYGIQIMTPPVEPNLADLDPDADELEERAAYQRHMESWQRQLDGITEVDLTVVIQGYGLPAEAIEQCRVRTGRPVVLWHGEVLGDHWPTDDEVVQMKVAQLQKNISAYDLVAHNCHTSLGVLMQLGARRVSCVPVSGVDPLMHRRMPEIPKQVDVLVYGWVSDRRYAIVKDTLEQLREGTTYAWADPSQGYYGASLMELINRARVVLNVRYSATPNTETRLYEALGCGVPVVSEPLSMPDLFPEGLGVRYGDSIQSLAQAIQEVLELPQAAYLDFADAGARLAHQYTYEARCAQLLQTVAKELGCG